MKKSTYSRSVFFILSFVVALTSCNIPQTNIKTLDKKTNSPFSLKTIVADYNISESDCLRIGQPVYDNNYHVNTNCGWRGETNGMYSCITCDTSRYCFNWSVFASQNNITPFSNIAIANFFNNETIKQYLYCNVDVAPTPPNPTPTASIWSISVSTGSVTIVDQKNLPIYIDVTPSETTKLWSMSISGNGYSKTYDSNLNLKTITFPESGINVSTGHYAVEVHYLDDPSITATSDISVVSLPTSSSTPTLPTPIPTITPSSTVSLPPTPPSDPPPVPPAGGGGTPTPTVSTSPSTQPTPSNPQPTTTASGGETPLPTVSTSPSTQPTPSNPPPPPMPTPTPTLEMCPIGSDWVITE